MACDGVDWVLRTKNVLNGLLLSVHQPPIICRCDKRQACPARDCGVCDRLEWSAEPDIGVKNDWDYASSEIALR
jgi:hypothetical protein